MHLQPSPRQRELVALARRLARKRFAPRADRQVLEHCQARPGWTVDGLGEELASPRGRLSASLSRLGRRGLLRPGGISAA